jgi:hypothetical protein
MKNLFVLVIISMIFTVIGKAQIGSQSQASLYIAPNPTIYGATTNGQLIWYSHSDYKTGAGMPPGKTIGFGGWQYYKSVFANGNTNSNIIYGVTTDGNLNWYNYADPKFGNAEIVGAKTIGRGGWQAYKSVFGGGNGIIYAITTDGNLVWYKYADELNGNQEVIGNKVIARFGWDQYKFVFSGGRGIIYAVNNDGNLYWYNHLGVNTGAAEWKRRGRIIIGTGGWNQYKFMFSGGNGIIYAVSYDGNLYWYNYKEYKTGENTITIESRRQIGTGGWSDFLYIFSAFDPAQQ